MRSFILVTLIASLLLRNPQAIRDDTDVGIDKFTNEASGIMINERKATTGIMINEKEEQARASIEVAERTHDPLPSSMNIENADQCWQCYEGATCTTYKGDTCEVHSNVCDPVVFQKYWSGVVAATATITAENHMGYENIKGAHTSLLPELETTIRALHAKVGNANPANYNVMPCYGATQCGLAVLNALSKRTLAKGKTKFVVTAQAPFYNGYANWPKTANDARLEWKPDVGDAADIEILNSPSNPAGEVKTKVVTGEKPVICDNVFDWPNYETRGDAGAADLCDILLFSQSKHTGHAGSRFGWALIKKDQEELYTDAATFIRSNTLGVSVDDQLRTNQILNHIITTYDDQDGNFYTKTKAIMDARWAKITEAVRGCSKITLTNAATKGATAWLKATEDDDATTLLATVKLVGSAGVSFGGKKNDVRLSMMDVDQTFDLIVERLTRLCA